jgi:hypothetical protein
MPSVNSKRQLQIDWRSVMPNRFRTTIAVALTSAAIGAALPLSMTHATGQAARPARTVDGKPNFGGVWQALNEAHWDLQAHEAKPAILTQPGVYPYEYARVPAAPFVALGATAGVPASMGVVQGDGQIPYKPEALKTKQENTDHWIDRDPELKCYLPGIPRAMYMPYPFQIVQSTNKIEMGFTFSNAARTIHLDKVAGPPDDTYMGFSAGRWEGDTLVVDVKNFNGKTWLDRAGNFHGAAAHLVERFTPISADALQYEVTIEDPDIFTRPWKISMPLYRRLEPHAQVIEYPCIEFSEEFLYGHVRKQQLVKRWEGETIVVDITRKVPQGDRFHEWFRR